MCRFGGPIGFTRQGYYQYWQRQNEEVDNDLNVLRLVRPIRRQHPRIGGRKLYYLLQPEFLERDIKLGRDGSPLRCLF
jgi:putative transposase